MNKLALSGLAAVAMSIGLVSTGYAQQTHHPIKHSVDRQMDAPAQQQRDFQALAPDARDGGSVAGRDPLDYNLGYFRNF